jgi:hypothetical protein
MPYGQATVSWTANGEGDLAGYQVLYGTVSGNLPFLVDVGLTATPATPSVTLTSFERYGLLYFAVKAYDNAVPPNVSLPSAEVSLAVAPKLRPKAWP